MDHYQVIQNIIDHRKEYGLPRAVSRMKLVEVPKNNSYESRYNLLYKHRFFVWEDTHVGTIKVNEFNEPIFERTINLSDRELIIAFQAIENQHSILVAEEQKNKQKILEERL